MTERIWFACGRTCRHHDRIRRMPKPEHVAILKQGVRAWNEWRKEHPESTPDLSRAVLVDADLRGAQFTGAKLTEAMLLGADLTGAQLCRVGLVGADLTRRTSLGQPHQAELSQTSIL
ncbi:MAG: pentapeptide repeat-containing protein [Verrucomicrobiales bacterium]|nr:pentapeptide repeat-containing protein [Verrucomicrobiales bacterium]